MKMKAAIINDMIGLVTRTDEDGDCEVEFSGSYQFLISNVDGAWKVVNGVNGYGHNCLNEFKNATVTPLYESPSLPIQSAEAGSVEGSAERLKDDPFIQKHLAIIKEKMVEANICIHIEKMWGGLEMASVQHFMETGKINGSFMLRLKDFAKAIAGAKWASASKGDGWKELEAAKEKITLLEMTVAQLRRQNNRPF